MPYRSPRRTKECPNRSASPFAALTEQKASGFQRIITGNESSFLLYYPRDSVWAPSRYALPQRIKQKIHTKMCLVSFFWLVNRIHSPFDVPTGTMCTTGFFTDAIIPSLIDNVRLRSHGKTLKGWLIHVDNAILTVRRGLKGVSGPQGPNARRIRLTAQTWPRVTSSFWDVSKENHLITIVRAGRIS
jgi:hypothetical protein